MLNSGRGKWAWVCRVYERIEDQGACNLRLIRDGGVRTAGIKGMMMLTWKETLGRELV